jgi:hypothetical protein
MKMTVFIVTAAFAVIAPAFADDAATPTAPAGAATSQGAATADDSYLDNVVCKVFPPPTGTRLGTRKICHTEREWRDITRRSQEDLSKRQTFHNSRPGE